MRLTGTVGTRVIHEDVYSAFIVDDGLHGFLHFLIAGDVQLHFVDVYMFELHGFDFACGAIDNAALCCVFITAATVAMS